MNFISSNGTAFEKDSNTFCNGTRWLVHNKNIIVLLITKYKLANKSGIKQSTRLMKEISHI